ncbi:MAG TPA: hypothetical protein VLU43_10010 [Anaeromyxobacteraceae bacterium]|nr:hypothetical protein [Anaeromyxobacteraceae bacterium]
MHGRDGEVHVILFSFLRLLHVLSMAVWLASVLWLPGDVRRSIARGGPHLAAAAERGGDQVRLDLYAGIATALTGIGLLWRRAWLARPALWVGVVVGLAMVGLVAFGLVPAWRRTAGRLAAGDAAGATATVPRLAALAAAGQLLWVIALALMVLPV